MLPTRCCPHGVCCQPSPTACRPRTRELAQAWAGCSCPWRVHEALQQLCAMLHGFIGFILCYILYLRRVEVAVCAGIRLLGPGIAGFAGGRRRPRPSPQISPGQNKQPKPKPKTNKQSPSKQPKKLSASKCTREAWFGGGFCWPGSSPQPMTSAWHCPMRGTGWPQPQWSSG